MNIYSQFLERGKHEKLVLATILKTRGSTPQVSGASALFSAGGLVYGTVGGGVLESEVIKQAVAASFTRISTIMEFSMDAGMTDIDGAICGGKATLLMDANPLESHQVFKDLNDSVSNNLSGLLITCIRNSSGATCSLKRFWIRNKDILPQELINKLNPEIWDVLKTRTPVLIKGKEPESDCMYYIEPVFPDKKLLIIGAGHVGSALCHISSLINFEVIVIDERPAFADPKKLPDAQHVIAGKFEEVLSQIVIDRNTYIVIVTQGHKNDSLALKHCIRSDAAYIGMIGSRRKIRLVKDAFIKNGWASKMELDEIHAPIGIDIDSESVQEIAVSIAAELIKVSKSKLKSIKRRGVSIIVLAAGESKRMGTQKMLLPYENKTIIETVVEKALYSKADHVMVVTGSHGPEIRSRLSQYAIDVVTNDNYRSGMMSSVLTGIRFTPDYARAFIIMLGDQPMVQTSVIDHLIEAYNNNAERIVIPVYNEQRGHPVLIDMNFRKEIESLDPQKGLRELMRNNPEEILEINVDSPEILSDIDTKLDYTNAINKRV